MYEIKYRDLISSKLKYYNHYHFHKTFYDLKNPYQQHKLGHTCWTYLQCTSFGILALKGTHFVS